MKLRPQLSPRKANVEMFFAQTQSILCVPRIGELTKLGT